MKQETRLSRIDGWSVDPTQGRMAGRAAATVLQRDEPQLFQILHLLTYLEVMLMASQLGNNRERHVH